MPISRRNFLQTALGVGAASAFSFPLFDVPQALADEAKKDLKIEKFTLNVGATRPFAAVHVSDTHVTFADEREVERKLQLAESRAKYFSRSEAFHNASVEYAKEKEALLLHTGDFIDFLSDKNLEYVKEAFDAFSPCFCSSGNHEFSHYLGEAREDEQYKMNSFERVQKYYPNDLKFCSFVYNGVNFVAFDDVYYYVDDDLIDRFKVEIDKGLPIVTLCHVPLYTPQLTKFMLEDQKEKVAWVLGAPDEVVDSYPEGRRESQRSNETTTKFLEWLKEQKLVKALLAGHLHVNHVGPFSETAMQYVVGGNFKGDLFEFSFE
ncbi:MAG: metallophosphoesterase [Thermoguttaceae bacterium]|nr:metallophosphoesterase [Thermoguttaceae bacterium]